MLKTTTTTTISATVNPIDFQGTRRRKEKAGRPKKEEIRTRKRRKCRQIVYRGYRYPRQKEKKIRKVRSMPLPLAMLPIQLHL